MARGWQKDGSVDDGFVAIFVVFIFVDELKEQLAVCIEMYSNSYRDSSS